MIACDRRTPFFGPRLMRENVRFSCWWRNQCPNPRQRARFSFDLVRPLRWFPPLRYNPKQHDEPELIKAGFLVFRVAAQDYYEREFRAMAKPAKLHATKNPTKFSLFRASRGDAYWVEERKRCRGDNRSSEKANFSWQAQEARNFAA